jgi:hypothetical protein
MTTFLRVGLVGTGVAIGLALAAGCDKSAAAGGGGAATTTVMRGAPINKPADPPAAAAPLEPAATPKVATETPAAAPASDAPELRSTASPDIAKKPATPTNSANSGTNGAASAKPDFASLRPAIKKPKDDKTPVGTPDKERPEYLRVDFDELATYDYDPYEAMPPDLGAGPAAAAKEYAGPPPAEPVRNAQLPPRILALNKKKVIIQGFMVPIEFKRDSVRSFLLVRNQMMCCFGAMIGMNEWVMVQMDGEKRTTFVQDVPTTVYGELDVGEDIENGMVMSLYRLRGLEVQFKGGR